MSCPSWREFRRHRAVEQGCSLPPPAPQASIVLLPVRKAQIGREILSQNHVKQFHSNPEPRQSQRMMKPGDGAGPEQLLD
jgi:hypothetical protein